MLITAKYVTSARSGSLLTLSKRGITMKKFAIALAAFAALSSVAYAQCPIGAPYRCIPGAAGKMICGCGV